MTTTLNSDTPDDSARNSRKRRPGRPSRLADTKALERFHAAIGLGLPLTDAAAYAGVARSTVNAWLALGHDAREMAALGTEPDPKHRASLDFLERVEHERAASIVRNLAIMTKAAHNGSWRAAAWLLERTRPDIYGTQRDKPASAATETTPPDRVSLDEIEDTIQRIIDMRTGQDEKG